MTRICIIDGHPDPAPRHLIHALCDAYAEGAAEERGVLGLSGFGPLHHTILGGAGDIDEAKFKRWCTDMRIFGREAV